MNRIEFYNKLDRYKQVHLDNEELQHSASNYGKQYYNKIDKYYPDGTARYFYSQAEWEAYQREKDQDKWRKQQEAKKKAEEKNNMSGYDTWKKNQTAKEEAKKSQANKLNDISDEKKQKQAEVYNKNAEAAANEGNREEYRREREAEWGRRKAIYNKQEQVHNDAANIRRNSAADAHEGDREQAKIEAQKRYDDAERAKYQGKKKLEEKQEAERKQREIDEIKRLGKENMEKAEKERKQQRAMEEAKKRAEEKTRKEQEAVKIEQGKIEYKQRLAKIKADVENRQAKIDAERKAIAEAHEEWQDGIHSEVRKATTEIEDAINACAESRDTKFKVDNELVDLFKEKLAQEDPDFDGDIAAYVRPNWGKEVLSVFTGPVVAKNLTDDNEHTAIAKKVLTDLKNDINKEVDETSVEDANYISYLAKLKDEQESKKNRAITADINTARISLGKMYNGDSRTFKLDDSLKKVLDQKLMEIDENYDGDLYKYVRPYLFGTWIKDDESYNNVKQALDQLEADLRNANKKDEAYGNYIERVSKLL